MSVFDQQRVNGMSAFRYRTNLIAKYLQLTDNFNDGIISANANTSSRIQIYRDLTIAAGIVLTANYSPQVIICRKLIFGSTSSQISANGKGATGGAASAVTPVGGNGGVANTTIVATAHIAPGSSTSIPSDLLDTVFPAGGAPSGTAVGGNGAAFPDAGLLLVVGGFALGAIVGGGGGGAGSSSVNAANALGGTKGYAGDSGAAATAAAGGSGVGGGGGGGGNATAAAGTGGAGGNGGGALYLYCDDIQGAAGLVTANGANGSAGGTNSGGGGGGGGGLVVLYTRLLTLTPTLQSNGGTGGAGTGATGKAGGNGGAGLAAIMRN